MAQLGHPYAAKVKSSQARRLRALGARAGKPFGSSAQQQSKTYSQKNAGSSTPMTISGGSSKARPDRMARGGSARRKGHSTTNIVIAQPGGGQGNPAPAPAAVPVPRPVPMPVNRPVPVPVRSPAAAMPPAGALPAGGPAGGLPLSPPVGVRPPGMKKGGAVKKAQAGGYAGFPHSPTSKNDDATSAGSTQTANSDVGEDDKYADGGGVEKRQLGGPAPGLAGRPGLGARPMRRQVPNPVPLPRTLAGMRAKPAPGTQPGYKKGGEAHGDEAQDRKLFKQMIGEEKKKVVKKRAAGGFVPTNQNSTDPGLAGTIHHQQGVGYRARGGTAKAPVMKASPASGLGRLQKSRMAASVPAKTEL